jgi:hypothetical protein
MVKGAEFFGNVTGVNETIANLHKINPSCARPAVASGMRKGMAVVRKAIKKECEHPSVSHTVASRFTRGRKRNTHIYAKVGLGVGERRQGKFQKSGTKNKYGYGMSTYNIHWYALGTGPRYKKTNGQYTGMMWGKRGMIPQPVRLGWLKSKGKAKKVMIDQMQRKFIENIKKKIKTKGFRKTLGV